MYEQTNARPWATIVIEWENVQLADESRCYEMLRRLAEQIGQVCRASACAASRFEVLLVYDDQECDGQEIRNRVAPIFGAVQHCCDLRFHGAPGTTYYEQKNVGARQATGEIIVFLDSDVIPEPSWLAALLSPFDDPKIQVVSGNTYLSVSDAYSKAFALFWFFPLRAPHATLEPQSVFFANNVAFRRELFLSRLFPAMPGASKGSCRQLSHQLRKDGIMILRQSAAQCSHPAPFGWKYYLVRGLAEGRDRVVFEKTMGKNWGLRSFNLLMKPPRAVWKMLRYRRRVELSLTELPLAMTVGVLYSTMVIVGYAMARIAPGYANARWQV